MDERRKFLDYLESRGKRLTREREAVITEVFSSRDAFDTDQIVNRVSTDRRVSLATVYRTLLDMVDAGLLRTIGGSDCHGRFERTVPM